METLKNFIEKNRTKFDSEQPSENHEFIFEQKLNSLSKRKQQPIFYTILKYAAVLIITFFITYSAFENQKTGRVIEVQLLTLSDLSEEYAEMEYFYIQTSYRQMDIIGQILTDNVPEQKEELFRELTALDSLHTSLQQELNLNPYDERVIDAMVKFYQFKVEILNQIIYNLKQVKSFNNQKYEKVFI